MFITLEGPEGSGKTSQIFPLSEFLKEQELEQDEFSAMAEELIAILKEIKRIEIEGGLTANGLKKAVRILEDAEPLSRRKTGEPSRRNVSNILPTRSIEKMLSRKLISDCAKNSISTIL